VLGAQNRTGIHWKFFLGKKGKQLSDLLLVDFGTSRIKCALWSTQKQCIVDSIEIASPLPTFGDGGLVEVSPESYWIALEATAGRMVTKYSKVDRIWLCTEMHGIIVADMKGLPLTPYISWRDGRGTVKDASGKTTLEKLALSESDFFIKSGMKLRSGLPIVSIYHLQSENRLPVSFRLFTLADWLLWRGGERDPGIHESLAAGTGLFDVSQKVWSDDLFKLASIDFQNTLLAKTVSIGSLIGCIELGGRSIQVFGGLGDLQATVFGTGFPDRANLVVNLGTGSQVLRAWNNIPEGIERRPGADGRDIAAITHIPSGRALNIYADFFNNCAILAGGQAFFWNRFQQLTVEQLQGSRLDVDMNLFASSWQWMGGGVIRSMNEVNFTPDELIASIAKAWLHQYVVAIEKLDPMCEDLRFLVSGGLARRLNFVPLALSTMSGRSAQLATSLTGEETLDGLLALARRCGQIN
jgi:hypothetical protein